MAAWMRRIMRAFRFPSRKRSTEPAHGSEPSDGTASSPVGRGVSPAARSGDRDDGAAATTPGAANAARFPTERTSREVLLGLLRSLVESKEGDGQPSASSWQVFFVALLTLDIVLFLAVALPSVAESPLVVLGQKLFPLILGAALLAWAQGLRRRLFAWASRISFRVLTLVLAVPLTYAQFGAAGLPVVVEPTSARLLLVKPNTSVPLVPTRRGDRQLLHLRWRDQPPYRIEVKDEEDSTIHEITRWDVVRGALSRQALRLPVYSSITFSVGTMWRRATSGDPWAVRISADRLELPRVFRREARSRYTSGIEGDEFWIEATIGHDMQDVDVPLPPGRFTVRLRLGQETCSPAVSDFLIELPVELIVDLERIARGCV